MHTKNARELSYANAALLLGLIEVLADKGVLTRSDLNTVIVDAINKLDSGPIVLSTEGAIELIKSLSLEMHEATSASLLK